MPRRSATAGQGWTDPSGFGLCLRRVWEEDSRGLTLRCDWGLQYTADAWIGEGRWLGMTISPSYIGEPECNGVIERFMRTLKEQCL